MASTSNTPQCSPRHAPPPPPPAKPPGFSDIFGGGPGEDDEDEEELYSPRGANALENGVADSRRANGGADMGHVDGHRLSPQLVAYIVIVRHYMFFTISMVMSCASFRKKGFRIMFMFFFLLGIPSTCLM